MIQDIIRQLWNAPRSVMLAVVLALAFLFICENGNKTKEKVLVFIKQRWKVLFFLYLAFILTGTIFSRQITNPYRKILNGFVVSQDTVWDREILENIFVFVPFSFLYLQAFNPPRPWESALLLTVITTAFIEISQLLFWLGFFQVADIIHNIIGGIIGIALWVTIKAIKERVSTKRKGQQSSE